MTGSDPRRRALRRYPRPGVCQGYQRRAHRLFVGQGVRCGTLEERSGFVSHCLVFFFL